MMYVGRKVSYEVKRRYIKALLLQEQSWYDNQRIEVLPGIVKSNLEAIDEAAGKGMMMTTYIASIFISSVVLSISISLLF